MDLLSSIRKSGSRGGVNFSWDEVSTSQHRENYLGHSLMAPVGRWQKNRDLSWYAKADEKNDGDETAEQRKVRERKEEIRRIKEAEEDELARALGLPVADRSGGEGSGANAISVGEIKRVIKETEAGDEEIEEVGKGRGFGDFVGKMAEDVNEVLTAEPEKGGLLRKGGEREGRKRDDSRERRHRRRRHRSRSGERNRHRSRSRERHKHRQGRRYYDDRRDRTTSLDRRERRHRSRSGDRRRFRREDREPRRDDREPRRDIDPRPRRSRSPDARNSRGRRE